MSEHANWSPIERLYLDTLQEEILAPQTEQIPTIVVANFPQLGKLTALRFLEWVQAHEDGVVSLPTGTTPEYFIYWMTYFLNQWSSAPVQKILKAYNLSRSKPPSLQALRFVQIDEFYPINAWQTNSFNHYVHRFYFEKLGINPKNALLINPNSIGLQKNEILDELWPSHSVDTTLRFRYPTNYREERQQKLLVAVDQFCTNYEKQIRDMGGIGFFLGGIGHDGHIGFNVRGTDHFSTTRLASTNYETQAVAARDLGGIEVARNRLVITVGLATITYNPNCIAIIIAAGDAKAHIVNMAITHAKSNEIPASALRVLSDARFYITVGAAKFLEERNYLRRKLDAQLLQNDAQQIITELAIQQNKQINMLKPVDFQHNQSAQLVAQTLKGTLSSHIKATTNLYKARIKQALQIPRKQIFLHTAPHHDDIMLGYIPYLARLIRDPSNVHYFNYLTSGFNAVTNATLLKYLLICAELVDNKEVMHSLITQNYFDYQNAVFRNDDILQHLDGIAAKDQALINIGTASRMLRNLNELYHAETTRQFRSAIEKIQLYLSAAYHGMKDRSDIQQFKGMIREWEADLLWGFFGFDCKSVIHSRLGFYKGDIFTENPEYMRDVQPILQTLKKIQPTIVTVALDPEGSGPDTHYKVLQAVTSALKQYQQESGLDTIEVWGYRNVWYRYQPFEADLFIPVSLMSMGVMQQTFNESFLSQAEASFPSHEYDGPFSGLAQKVQVEQYKTLFTLLGQNFFYQNSDSRIRSTRGIIYLKRMSLDEFYHHSRVLKAHFRDRPST